MNFSELYINNKRDAEKKIAALWGGEANTESQRAQVEKLKEEIGNIFAPEEAVPVVQCMNSYKSVHSVAPDAAKSLVGSLWTSDFAPYEHQYQSWHWLLEEKEQKTGKPMSICVTTGTGSGKTECFMMPLVYDLAQNYQMGQIQALFLYPLNALMEDQKERLEKMLANIEASTGVKLTYTVYNGDLPDDVPSKNDDSDDANRIRRKIEMIRGLITDNQGRPLDKNGNPTTDENEYQYKYPRMVYTRKDVRRKDAAPNILLTNPTMLEYILLRKTDEHLIDPKKQSLRWVAIDETHTYTGAGAAELAMLLRRVMLAFGMDAKDVRFATSSATFVNNADIEDPAERENKEKQAELQLKTFISDLTGTSVPQVKVIDGQREGEDLLESCDLPADDKERWKTICHADYIELNKLFPVGTIAEKLQQLDDMCQQIEDLYAQDVERLGKKNAKILMKCKVHYFYRVPNNGMYVRLNEFQNGAFKVYTQKPIEQEEDKLPLLELCRCKHCGEFLAVGMLEKPDGKLYPMESSDSDMFDLGGDDNDDDTEIKQTVFALSKTPVNDDDHTGSYDIVGLNVKPSTAKTYRPTEWHIIGNEYRECPCCRKKLTQYGSIKDKKKEESDAEETMEDMRLIKLRLSSEFISRILAPSTLDQLDEATSQNSITLHSGQQFLSFVDSRQAAAKSTMSQNLEQERLWFYTTIYHELCRLNSGLSLDDVKKKLEDISVDRSKSRAERTEAMEFLDELEDSTTSEIRIKEIIKQVSGTGDAILSWDKIANLLLRDEYFMVFCHQFIKRTEDSEDIDSDGNIKEEAKLKYLYSIMVLYLGNRPATAASPETMGLFRPYYTFLDDIKKPASVDVLNGILKNSQIEDKDWQNLIQVFIDYTIRSNQSVFLNMTGNNRHRYDIFSCERYATEKPRRRPVIKPKYEKPGDISESRLVRLISGLITRDQRLTDDNKTQIEYFNVIKPVIDDLWKALEDNKILEQGTHYDEEKDKDKQILDKDDTALRFNLAKMSFALYDDVYLCDTNTEAKANHVAKRRPIQTNFMGFSPYLIGNRAVVLDESLHEKWENFDGFKDGGKKYDAESLNAWAAEKRPLLWNNGLWGEDGVFSDRLNNIHLVPNLFIQAEHTAQVDKMVARQLQAQFKDHSINILACSTTMEMGVDLGNLEVVMLTSVPPLPANYKQRAGRSGRNNKVKSVCVTLCGSDAIGLRTLLHPIETIIKRPVDVPTVDLDSRQVVMRHVISYLIRSFGVFANGNNGGSLNQMVLDFYTPFKGVWDKNLRCYIYYDENNNKIDVDSGMGSPIDTNYRRFSDKCSQSMSPKMKDDMQTLLNKTPFIGRPEEVLTIAQNENERCYNELSDKVENLKSAKRNADPNSKGFNSYMTLLRMEYMEIVGKKLLNYWATNRFTPNANMPVNIMSLDLNATKLKSKKDKKRNVSNPSYTLRQAIQQYVPGNSIVVDGVVYIVRGLTTQDAYTDGKTIKQLYRNANKTVVGQDVTLDSPIPWDVNGRENLSLVQPARFLPDPNEDYSRIVDDNIYTHVSAQLIGTNDWGNKVTEPNLFSTRRSDDSGKANILYYNEGIGYGYAMCIDCGKMCIETGQVEEGKTSIPNNIDDRQSDKGRYHFSIDREKKYHCFGSGKKDRIKRNVIIGDLMQTDYCEIRFRHPGDTSWITFSRNEKTDCKNRNLLITLGIVFCQSLIELKGWERGSVDFAVMQNRHLCIFDTNPGGSGYSIKLHDNQTMLDVIAGAKKLLEKAKAKDSKDMLLDKFTLRFLKYIDIDGALEWIAEQEEAKGIYPDPIPSVFGTNEVHMSSVRELLTAYANSTKESFLFVDDNFNKWNFGTSDSGWQGRLLGEFFGRRNNTTFCIAQKSNKTMPEGIKQMLREVKVIFDNPVATTYFTGVDIYPLAYIDDRLYFTINDDSSTLNECWGDGVLYCIKTVNPAKNAKEIDCTANDATTQLFFLDDSTCIEKTSADIGELIYSHDAKAKGIIDAFIDHCNNSNGDLYVSYQDEHMKSVAAIVLTLQTVEFFVKKIKKDFELEFFTEEYNYEKAKYGIFANLENSVVRDEKLERKAESWVTHMDYDFDIIGTLIDIESQKAGSLTHWRVLNFECNGKRLSIYPDGGLLNGWSFDKSRSNKFYDADTTTHKDAIPIKRQQAIKYEVHLEDIG